MLMYLLMFCFNHFQEAMVVKGKDDLEIERLRSNLSSKMNRLVPIYRFLNCETEILRAPFPPIYRVIKLIKRPTFINTKVLHK